MYLVGKRFSYCPEEPRLHRWSRFEEGVLRSLFLAGMNCRKVAIRAMAPVPI